MIPDIVVRLYAVAEDEVPNPGMWVDRDGLDGSSPHPCFPCFKRISAREIAAKQQDDDDKLKSAAPYDLLVLGILLVHL